MYPVVEIFESFQGEGRFLGNRATFVRFGGCNLTCPWCDTDHSKYEMMTAQEIVDRLKPGLVIFTGGEPTLQDLKSIHDLNPNNESTLYAIETNGTQPVPDFISWVACSPKEQGGWMVHPSIYTHAREFKYVVDESFELECIKETASFVRVWLQPEASNPVESTKKAIRLLSGANTPSNYLLGIQAHKYWEVQ